MENKRKYNGEPILVVYINVEGLTEQESKDVVKQYNESLSAEGLMYIYVPTYDFATRIECIHPQIHLNENEYSELKDKIEHLIKLQEEKLKINE